MSGLVDLEFEAWLAHVFEHDVSEPQWYFDIDADYWAGPPETAVAHLVRLFQEPEEHLSRFTDAQLNQGFWYLLGTESEIMFGLVDERVDQLLRLEAIRSFYPLFSQLFAVRCTPTLSHLDEPSDCPLNSACYMWWDILPIAGSPNEPARKSVDTEILEVMKRILKIDSLPCQESALHGLGHWQLDYPQFVQNVIDEFLTNNLSACTRLVEYAKHARVGYVL